MEKQIIRLTESDLHNIIRESVYQILEQKGVVNEGWKNWAMAGALGAATMFGNPQSANAQNCVVDDLNDPNEVVGKKIDRLILDPNKSIKENYAKIDSLMSLHKENQQAEYTILIEGHYTNKRNESYDWNVGMIQVKGKNNEQYRTISGQIIEALTELYSNSLDESFHVTSDQYTAMSVNEKPIKVETGRTFKHQNGKVTKEYVTRKGGGNILYSLYPTSPLYKKIYNKVVQETGLQDGGTLYDLRKRNEKLMNTNDKDNLHNILSTEKQEVPSVQRKPNKYGLSKSWNDVQNKNVSHQKKQGKLR